MNTDNFEKVSSVIAVAMDEAWNKILENLSGGNTDGFTGDIETEELTDFLNLLGGARMRINLPCVIPKGERIFSNAHQYNSNAVTDAEVFFAGGFRCDF